ncbi:hypothetical protein [Cetobacterium sp.]|uniref:hypothetical protein n=1 Tax=Cetobacterium sp. TaxID=2071632 RepID=UPI003F338EC2
MRKGLVLLSLIAMFAACGKKEEESKAEIVAPVVVEQVVEEKKVEEVVIPVVAEETITEVVVTENKTSEVTENIEESVVADVAETTGGDVVVEMPTKEETIVAKEVPVEEVGTVTTEEKIAQ